MTEEQTTPHPDYLKGFNEGYILAKHLPELTNKLTPGLPDNERGKGMLAGKDQYEQEKRKEAVKGWHREEKTSEPDKSISTSKEKDDHEREH